MTTRRPSFPSSSSDFALRGPSSSSSSSSNSNGPLSFPLSGSASKGTISSITEDLSPFVLRFRRPSLLAPVRGAEGRHSPLRVTASTSASSSSSSSSSTLAVTPSSSFTLPFSRRYSTSIRDESESTETETMEESESDRDNKMLTDSPPDADSGAATPALADPPPSAGTPGMDSDSSMKSNVDRTGGFRSPSSPPPSTQKHVSKNSIDGIPDAPALAKIRRLSHPIKVPRILTLLSESRPEENEVKSEAQFQRLIQSYSDIPRTPRLASSDRGRYPEEVDTEETQREDTPSDDDDDLGAELDMVQQQFAYTPSEPISIVKPVTPAQSISGDDISESPVAAMDVDMPSSSFGSPNLTSWRYTPPPTSSAVRSNKRKFDDRYDPYPTASKRRAVSPSISALFNVNPRTPSSSRVPLPLPISISIPPGLSSGASSPVVPSSSSGNPNGRPLSLGSASASALSSPTLRAQIGLASPILRPMIRARREGEGREGREVEGAGEAVHSLSLE